MTETPGKRSFHSAHFPLRGSATKSFFPTNTVQEPTAQAFPEALGTLQKTGSWQIHQLQSFNIINRQVDGKNQAQTQPPQPPGSYLTAPWVATGQIPLGRGQKKSSLMQNQSISINETHETIG